MHAQNTNLFNHNNNFNNEDSDQLSHIQQRTKLLNRKQTQVEFLQQENQQLKADIQELQNLVRLNKQAVQVFIEGESAQKSLAKTDPKQAIQNEKQSMQKVMKSLYEENDQMLHSIERLIEERNIANGKALITEQMLDVAERQQLENSKEQENKLVFLQQQVQEYQNLLQQNQIDPKTIMSSNALNGQFFKQGQIPSNNNIISNGINSKNNYNTLITNTEVEMEQVAKVVTKYREILKPNDQIMKMYEEFQKYNCYIDHLIKKVNFQADQNQQLMNITLIQGEDIVKLNGQLQAYIKKTCSKCKLVLESYNHPGSVKDVIEFHQNLMNVNQKEILEQEIEQRMLSPLTSPLPDRVVHFQSPRLLPLLNLSKALYIQQINISKHTIAQEKKLFSSSKEILQNEIKKQKEIMQDTRNQLALEMLNCKKTEIENDNLKRINEELENRIDTLLKSQNLYEEKWKKIYSGYKFYRNFYKKMKDGANHNSSRLPIIDMHQMDSSRMIKQQQKDDSLNHNKSIIDFNPDNDVTHFEENKFINVSQQFFQNPNSLQDQLHDQQQIQDKKQQKDFIIKYLMTLAKGVYGTFNSQQQQGNFVNGVVNLKKKKQTNNQVRMKRSNSNPAIMGFNEIGDIPESQTPTNLNSDIQTLEGDNKKNQIGEDKKYQTEAKKQQHKKNVSVFLPSNKQMKQFIDFEETGDLDNLQPNEGKYNDQSFEQDQQDDKDNDIYDISQSKIQFDVDNSKAPSQPSISKLNVSNAFKQADLEDSGDEVDEQNHNQNKIDQDKSYNIQYNIEMEGRQRRRMQRKQQQQQQESKNTNQKNTNHVQQQQNTQQSNNFAVSNQSFSFEAASKPKIIDLEDMQTNQETGSKEKKDMQQKSVDILKLSSGSIA